MTADPARRTTWLDRLALAPALAIVAFTLAGPVQSGDVWWHVRVGDWIREHRALPWQDPFSHTAGDALYVPQEMGSQVLFSLLDAAGGVGLLRAFGALIGAALVLAFARLARRHVGPGWAAALAAVFAAAYAIKWELRPHLFSTFVLLWLFERFFPPDRTRSLGPDARTTVAATVVTLVWVQFHAEAVFAPLFTGLGLVACAIGAGVDRLRDPATPPWSALTRWGVAFAATTAASFASPLGWWPHRYALFKRAIPKLYIDEWFPAWIPPSDPRFAPLDAALAGLLLVLLAVALAVLVRGAYLRLARAPNAPHWERLALLAACVFLALTARRYLWLLVVPALDALLALHRASPRSVGERLAAARALPMLAAFAAAFVLAQSNFPRNTWAALREGRFAEPADRRLFPVHATALLAETGPAGNLFHPYDWGGYLLYHLGPEHPIFIDGRTTLFEHVVPERWHAERDPAIGRQVLAARDVRAIVSRRFLLGASPPSPYRPPDADARWIRAHADALAELWVRADERDALDALDAWYSRHGVPFDAERGFVELEVWLARPEWLVERDLLPRPVARALAPAVDAVRAAPADHAAWLALARATQDVRLGRSARFALERSIQLRGELDPTFDAAAWRARLASDGVAPVVRALAAGT